VAVPAVERVAERLRGALVGGDLEIDPCEVVGLEQGDHP
jgi:hypothetical protein